MDVLQLDESYTQKKLKRKGFSGGEEKDRILQLMMVKPSLAI